jgi:hypothetical protein
VPAGSLQVAPASYQTELEITIPLSANDEYALYTEEKEDNYLPTLPENRNLVY